MNSKLNHQMKKIEPHKNKIIWLIVAFVAIATLPPPAGMLNTQVDASGAIGIMWAIQQELQIGEDVMMQIGPLGHLFTNAYVFPSLWFQSMLYVLFTHVFLVFSISLLAIKLAVKWKDYLLIFPVITTLSFLTNRLTDVSDQLQISVVVFFYLLITGKISDKYKNYLLIFISILLAIHSLIKFDMTIMSLFAIIIFSAISICKKEPKNAIIISSSYILFITLFWVLSNQDLNNFPSYFVDGFLFSSGYSYALAIEGQPVYEIYLAIVGMAFVIIVFIFSIITKTKNLTIFILLYGFLFFASFKHAFVRHDLHVFYFPFTYGLFFLSAYLILKYHSGFTKYNKKQTVIMIFLVLSAILCVAYIDHLEPKLIIPDISKTVPIWGTVIPLALDESHQTQIIEGFKEHSNEYFQLDEKALKIIRNKTMDILPWDVALAWGHSFNWSTPPVWQSFLVFNPRIDEINARHYSDENAPEVVLYTSKSIDLRYPLFDLPQTISTILQNYKYEHTSGDYVILSKVSEEEKIQESLNTIKVKIGEPIIIPKYESGYLFAKVDLQFSTYGKIMNMIYKPSEAHMRFKFSDSSYSDEFRFIPIISKGGLFVSQYVSDVQDLKSIFSHKINQDISEIILYVDEPDHYEKEIEIEFVGIQTDVQVQDDVMIYRNIQNWNELKNIDGGLHSIDFIGSRLIKYEQGAQIIENDSEGFQFIEFHGWGIDTIANDGNVKKFIVLQNEKETITIPTKKIARPDLVSVFKVESFLNGGWKTIINSNEIENGCYTLSLRILSLSEQEYFEMGKTEKPLCFG